MQYVIKHNKKALTDKVRARESANPEGLRLSLVN